MTMRSSAASQSRAVAAIQDEDEGSNRKQGELGPSEGKTSHAAFPSSGAQAAFLLQFQVAVHMTTVWGLLPPLHDPPVVRTSRRPWLLSSAMLKALPQLT